MDNHSIQPFLLPGGPTGCLLIHGFGGTPAEMRGLGEHLATRGYTVLGVSLAGHTSNPEDLSRTRWHDWLSSAEEGFKALRSYCTHVVVVGFSMGGALAILLARRHVFEGLVLLATPLRLKGDWRLQVLPLLRYVVPWYYPLEQANFHDPAVQQRIHEFLPDADFTNPEIVRKIRRSAKISVGAVDELQKVLRHARANISHITMPTLIMHGRDDDTADPAHAEEIMQHLGSTRKRLIWWNDTGHQLLVNGPHREAIYVQVAAFAAEDRD